MFAGVMLEGDENAGDRGSTLLVEEALFETIVKAV